MFSRSLVSSCACVSLRVCWCSCGRDCDFFLRFCMDLFLCVRALQVVRFCIQICRMLVCMCLYDLQVLHVYASVVCDDRVWHSPSQGTSAQRQRTQRHYSRLYQRVNCPHVRMPLSFFYAGLFWTHTHAHTHTYTSRPGIQRRLQFLTVSTHSIVAVAGYSFASCACGYLQNAMSSCELRDIRTATSRSRLCCVGFCTCKTTT
jgi:hypothetical protein